MSEAILIAIVCVSGIVGVGLVGGGLMLWKRRKSKPSENQSGTIGFHAVERITAMFPALQRNPTQANGKNMSSILGLQGNLAQTPLPDLLQYLALGSKTGILELTCGRRTGRIVMNAGRVAKSFYRGKESIEATYLMLDLSEGDFEFFDYRLEDTESFDTLDVVDIIMMWMEKKPKKKSASR